MRLFTLSLTAFALVVAMAVVPATLSDAQARDKERMNEEVYASLLSDFISVLPNTFNVAGTNPNGSTYSGTAYVYFDVPSGDLFVEWQVGSQQFRGNGPLIGGEFIVDWGQSSPVIYTVQSNGDLFGLWSNGNASETLTLQ